MIEKKEIDFYLSKVGQPYDKNKEEDSKANSRIKTNLLKSMINASKNAAELLYGSGKENYVLNDSKNAFAVTHRTSMKFSNLLFTRISPRNKFSPIVQYWFRVDGKTGKIKIGIGLKDDRKTEALENKAQEIRDKTKSKIESTLEITESITDEALSEWVYNSIKKFEVSYEDFCSKLQPDLDEALSKWTERQEKKKKNNHEQNIWKMSHGKEKNIIESSHNWLIDNGYLAIGFVPGDRQRKKFEEMRAGDFFYLVRNSKVVLLGQIENQEITNTPEHLNQPNWVMRKFIKIKDPVRDLYSTQVKGKKKGWKPEYNSTINEVGKNDLVEFEETILQPAFGLNLTDLQDSRTISPINKQTDKKGRNSIQIPRNQILYGPPGTGKTYITAEKAIEIINKKKFDKKEKEQENYRMALMDAFKEASHIKSNKTAPQITFVTFHQSYGYEEFVEGLRPILTKDINLETDERLKSAVAHQQVKQTANEFEVGEVQYEIRSGAFKRLCDAAHKDPDKNYVIIIDEINRGNISKIFGELITLIEDSKRTSADNHEALTVMLPYSQEPFSVPSNVYIIGTMNTADRSLAQVDIALRRRFHFEEMLPNPGALDKPNKLKVGEIEVSKMLDKINKRIEALYDIHHTIGHAYFIGLNSKKEDEQFLELQSIFLNKIIPLLQEYFIGDWSKIRMVLGSAFFENKRSDGKLFEEETDLVDDPDIDKYQINVKAFAEVSSYTAIYSQTSEKLKLESENGSSE